MSDSMVSGSNHVFNECRFTIHNQPTYSNPVPNWQDGWNTLCKNVAHGAIHNSSARYDAPKCHEGTRVAVIRRIMEWIQDFTIFQVFTWIYGPAGAGKSAIAGSVADMCHIMGIWTASFFFSRHAAERNSDKHLAATLAYQLCTWVPGMREIVGETINKDPLIFTRALSIQLEDLIIVPIRNIVQVEEIRRKLAMRSSLFIIDGLDESGDGQTQKRILDALLMAELQFDIPIVILIASRPELEIRKSFSANPFNWLTNGTPLDDMYQANEDIYKFLKDKFAGIKADHILRHHIDPSWPGEETLRLLVRKSSGQFIYASTVVKYIESDRHRPQDRLQVILGLIATNTNETPFAMIDALYIQILSSVDDLERVLEILMYMTLYSPAFGVDVRLEVIERQLSYNDGDVFVILCDMHALLRVPADREDEVEFYHASFGDFLSDKSRSGVFFIDRAVGYAKRACKLVKFITRYSDSEHVDEDHFYQLVQYCQDTTLSSDISDLGSCLHTDLFSVVLDHLEWREGFRMWNKLKDCLKFKQNGSNTEAALTAQRLGQYYHSLEDNWLRPIFKTLHPHTMSALAAYIAVSEHENLWSNDIPAEILEYPEAEQRNRYLRSILEREFSLFRYFADFEDYNVDMILRERLLVVKQFLSDQERSGPYFVDDKKWTILCQRLVDWVFERYTNDLIRMRIVTDEDQMKYLNLIEDCERILQHSLPNCGQDRQLAEVLREAALVVPTTKSHLWKSVSDEEWNWLRYILKEIAIASLEYVKRCNVPYLEHTHPCDGTFFCAICDDPNDRNSDFDSDDDSEGNEWL